MSQHGCGLTTYKQIKIMIGKSYQILYLSLSGWLMADPVLPACETIEDEAIYELRGEAIKALIVTAVQIRYL